jgi:probable rRNA maturation factor
MKTDAGIRLVILRKKIPGLTAVTLDRFVRQARRAVRLHRGVNILVTSSGKLRTLNRQFRGTDKATDVLSFPTPLQVEKQSRPMAGEIAISADIARQNADELGHSVAEEIKILCLHGILHLAGFDHERDNGEMARIEQRLRKRLKLESGLIERAQSGHMLRDNKRSGKIVSRRRTA